MLWGFIGENDHQVIIAVRPSVPACSGAKEVNPFRVIHSHQPADDLSQHGIVNRGRLHHLLQFATTRRGRSRKTPWTELAVICHGLHRHQLLWSYPCSSEAISCFSGALASLETGATPSPAAAFRRSASSVARGRPS